MEGFKNLIIWVLCKIFRIKEECLPMQVKKWKYRIDWKVKDGGEYSCPLCGHNRFATKLKHRLFICRNCGKMAVNL